MNWEPSILRAIGFAYAAAVACTPPGPIVYVPSDAGEGPEYDTSGDFPLCDKACGVLVAVECPEGTSMCRETCIRNIDILPVECVAESHTRDDVRACGLRCIK